MSVQHDLPVFIGDVRTQIFGDKEYSVPTVVNYVTNTSSEYRSSYGKTTSEYTNSLSIHAGFDASFPGFSSSVSADYRESQRRNLSNSFTRIAFNVTHYNLSLPPISQIPRLLKPWFIDELNNRDPIAFFREYGTHILSSVAIGGQALFLYSTDTRTYTAQMSIEAAAKISASYCVASGKMSLTAPQKKAMDSLNESSETTVVTSKCRFRTSRLSHINTIDTVCRRRRPTVWKRRILEKRRIMD